MFFEKTVLLVFLCCNIHEGETKSIVHTVCAVRYIECVMKFYTFEAEKHKLLLVLLVSDSMILFCYSSIQGVPKNRYKFLN